MVRQSRPADDEVSNHHDFLDERSVDIYESSMPAF